VSKKLKKVFVSGCYDLIHAGHITFFKTAAQYGKLYVGIGSDKNIQLLKGKTPYFSQDERIYIASSIRYVKEAFINSGFGMLDFEPELKRIRPDIFVVNRDGHTPEKEALCNQYGIEYKVLERIPEPGLPVRYSSVTKNELRFPYRLCLAGGWMDQPWVSKVHSGSVVVAQIWPTFNFSDRSGLATSSRKIGIKIWGNRQPDGDPIVNAKILFGAENPPGTKYVSGSQDHIGLLCPGINRLFYTGSYWPKQIDSNVKKENCEWLSHVIQLIPLAPRPTDYDPLRIKNLRKEYIKALGEAGDLCYKSILKKDIHGLGASLNQTFLMWNKILPETVPDRIMEMWKSYSAYPGAITSGSGGGYMIVVSEIPIKNAIKIKIKN